MKIVNSTTCASAAAAESAKVPDRRRLSGRNAHDAKPMARKTKQPINLDFLQGTGARTDLSGMFAASVADEADVQHRVVRQRIAVTEPHLLLGGPAGEAFELFKLTDKIYFDMSRQVLIFGNIPLGS